MKNSGFNFFCFVIFLLAGITFCLFALLFWEAKILIYAITSFVISAINYVLGKRNTKKEVAESSN